MTGDVAGHGPDEVIPVRRSTTVPNVSNRTARTSEPVDGERYGRTVQG